MISTILNWLRKSFLRKKIQPKIEYPINQVRGTVPIWRYDEFLKNMIVNDEEEIQIKLHTLREEDLLDTKLLKRKMGYLNDLIQSKYN